MTIAILKVKIDTLEKQLLAISSLNDICPQSINSGNHAVNLESCAELLDHLVEPAMYQVEAVRMMLADIAKRLEGQTHSEVITCS
ncbi:MAG: hypothetical protein Q7K26_05910 [bacterium]|nr:hypothetical protein [bacterium]